MTMLRLTLALVASTALGEHAVVLTSSNFDESVENSDIVLVKFYAPWCGHCKAMAPAYEAAAEKLAGNDPAIILGKVDVTEDGGSDLAQKYGIGGYPTLKVFRKGVASDYSGPRDADGIVKYMLDVQNPVTPISDEDSPLLMAKLCRDQTCGDVAYPIMEYDDETKKCGCSIHPCWDDNGQHHTCEDPAFHHLSFSYTAEGKLECGCKKEPHNNNKYIGKEKCPGHHCDSADAPILDWVPEEEKCVCRAHPCEDINGARHQCGDPKFPILHYREEVIPGGGGIKQVCECKARFHKKVAEEEL